MSEQNIEISAPTPQIPKSADNGQKVDGDDSKAQPPHGAAQKGGGKPPGADNGPGDELKADYDERKTAESYLLNSLVRRSTALAVGIPYLIFGLVVIAGYEYSIYSLIFQHSKLEIQSPIVRVLILWFLTAAVSGTFFYFSVQSRINRAKANLRRIDEAIEIKRLATIRGRLSYYREKLSKLTTKTARVFFFDTERYEKAECFRSKAVESLDASAGTVTAADLSEVETNLTALEEIINREEREQKEQRSWQYAALAVMCLYIAGLIGCVVVFKAANSSAPTPIFNVPLAVVVWGAAGSLAAILYRLYTVQGRIRFASEFRWLIARPIIGIIMGAVVYLAIKSGLILLGAANDGQTPAAEGVLQAGRIEVYSVIAFLAGFSDRFYLGVIDLLVSKTVSTREVTPNVIVTEKQRVPEIHPADAPQEGL